MNRFAIPTYLQIIYQVHPNEMPVLVVKIKLALMAVFFGSRSSIVYHLGLSNLCVVISNEKNEKPFQIAQYI